MTAPKPPTFRLTDDDTDGERRCDLQIFCAHVARYDYLVTIDEERARAIIAQLTAWLDAPRLAARETAEVVARDDEHGFRLLRTTAGEWGVLCQDNEDDEDDGEIRWHATERLAREEYATERGKALCICGAEEDDDEIDNSGDEPLCRKCVAEAQEAFKAQPMRCEDETCGWTGTGADLIAAGSEADWNDDNGPHECPKCCGWTVYEADDATGGGQ